MTPAPGGWQPLGAFIGSITHVFCMTNFENMQTFVSSQFPNNPISYIVTPNVTAWAFKVHWRSDHFHFHKDLPPMTRHAGIGIVK
jgi:hypothetical protein